ncbi:MAG: nitrous oxide-stimulated promoter family protein [Candidatus Omnitrophica bacterium]|nr:nitrous oxide-stimulated promoter family protein [Candidatus Omnitrophota bacterium]MBU1997429.1 nitrous oxide-stimulated promoter family protein [Candidatus Omnitrophota bacterium]MBU4333218.1 nitrous oxide-stimulated promoter family protein [Candidatus Omnitrophota bacterium]
MKRAERTVEAMIQMYCHDHHLRNSHLCSDCKELLEYSFSRIEKCCLKVNKSTCAKCPSHCYNPQMKERIILVMRYSGPRMIYCHPILATAHLIKSMKS